MKIKGFHASTSGGKKVVAVSLILAIVLASISVIAAFAAPTKSKSAFGGQLGELEFDRVWFNSARLNAANFVRTSDPVRAQQYLSQYAFALRQADTIVAGRGTNPTNNNNSNNSSNSSSSNNNSTNFGSAQGDLAGWLHMMRGLQEKLANIGFSASVSSSNVAGGGVPVTGGTGASAATATPGTSSSSTTPTAAPTTSNSSSSSAVTATPGASSSSTTPTAAPTTSSSSSSSTGNAGIPNTGGQATLNRSALAKIWGPQFNQLEAARAWLDNFTSNAANLNNSSDPAKTQQWLAQYRFALRQADAIVVGRGTNVTNNNNNSNNSSSSSSSSTNSTNFGSVQGDLAQWLHMMRDLQVKLTSGVNGTNSSTSSMP